MAPPRCSSPLPLGRGHLLPASPSWLLLLLLGVLAGGEEMYSGVELVSAAGRFERYIVGAVFKDVGSRVEALSNTNTDDDVKASQSIIDTLFEWFFLALGIAFMSFWLCAWNFGVSGIFKPAFESFFRGEYFQGLTQFLVGCICPHTWIGIALPLAIPLPWCLIYYFPYVYMIYDTWREVRGSPDDEPSRRMSSRSSLAEVVEMHRHPRLSLTRSFSSFTSQPEPTPATAYNLERGRLAEEMSECLICGQSLFTEEVGVCLRSQPTIPLPQMAGEVRVCKHYFHQRCLSSRAPGSCPICREPFQVALPLPELSTEPMSRSNEAFFYLASCGGYNLQKEDLKGALAAVTPFSGPSLDTAVQDMTAPTGSMSRVDFEYKVPAFVAAVRQPPQGEHMGSLPSAFERQPVSRTDLFELIDTRSSGKVDRAQLLRGLWQSERIRDRCSKDQVEAAVYNIYRVYFSHKDGIGREDFCRIGGFFTSVCTELRIQPFLQ